MASKFEHSSADMSQVPSIVQIIEVALDTFGALDILVNNAGIQHVAPLQVFPTAKWDAVLAINLSAAFHTTRLVLPKMIEKKSGRIIKIASAHGLIASPYKGCLCRRQARNGGIDQSHGS